MAFKEHRNPKDAMAAIGKGLTPAERRILSAPVPMPRPKWANDHVVDPDWLKAFPKLDAHSSPEPFTLLGNEQVKQLHLLFDEKLFVANQNVKHTDGAQNLLEAVVDLLEDIVEIAEADPTVMKSARALEGAISSNLLGFLGKIRGLTVDALSKAEDEMDRHDFFRGIFEHYIMQNDSDITAYELLEAAIDDLDDKDLERYDLMSIPRTPVRIRP